MKRIFTLLFCIAFINAFAGFHTILISGNTYTPNNITAAVGDTIAIQASNAHPLVQVDITTWNNNGATPVGGGWGTKTADYQFQITQMGDIYYVCSAHVQMGMKGKITVISPTGVAETARNSNVSVFPNPVSNGYFTVVTGDAISKLSLDVYDILGKLVQSQELGLGVNTLFSPLPSGTYYYTVRNNENGILNRGKLYFTR